jgi:hypothetical protein
MPEYINLRLANRNPLNRLPKDYLQRPGSPGAAVVGGRPRARPGGSQRGVFTITGVLSSKSRAYLAKTRFPTSMIAGVSPIDRRQTMARRQTCNSACFGQCPLRADCVEEVGDQIVRDRSKRQTRAGLSGAQAGFKAGGRINFASFRRFCAVAARRNSSRAPKEPLSLRRSRRRMRFRCANSISIFFRSRRDLT